MVRRGAGNTGSIAVALGWPPEREIGYGGPLRLVSGFMVFESVKPRLSTPAADKRGDARPAAVGWPRVDNVDGVADALDAHPPSAGPHASPHALPQASPAGGPASGCGPDHS